MSDGGLDPARIGPVLFKNYGQAPYLLMKKSIFSIKTLKQTVAKAGLMEEEGDLPEPVLKLYNKSMPNFKTQRHFYGYDGRGSHPTRFDCNYTYNLGLTVFSLVANGATGQMAAIRHLEHGFGRWEPMGLPIAPLMRLEERKGRLTLVLEKSVVDVQSPAFRVVQAFREKWLAASPGEDQYRRPGQLRLDNENEEDRPITLLLNAIGS